jgi:hypothetical protein
VRRETFASVVSQRGGEAGGSLLRVVPERVASGPGKAGAGQYCQMAQVRRAWRKEVREEPVFTSLKAATSVSWRLECAQKARRREEATARSTPARSEITPVACSIRMRLVSAADRYRARPRTAVLPVVEALLA